ncbi:MAG TPA: hypothetical protein VKM94_24370 [Blastocatellia bacterium]|nr:hypothetical protein [Blastocatellia bacterium]
MKKGISAVMVCAVMLIAATPGRSQAAREATIEPETKAKIILQSRLSSKLSEVGDQVSAVLDEPIAINGQLVLQRGTEFRGRVAAVSPAKRGQKSATIAIVFDRIAMPWGEEPVAVTLTSIDDWDKDEKLKADDEGKVKGGHRGDKTAENVIKGGAIGGGAAGVILLSTHGTSSASPAGAAALGGGLLAGLLMTKGADVQVAPGAVFRIKFMKPITLPIISQPGSTPRPIQQDEKPPAEKSTGTSQQF